MRLLTTMLLIVVIGAGASYATKVANFDELEDRLKVTTDRIDLGSRGEQPTPVVIPEATPGFGPWVEAASSSNTIP